MPMKRHQKSTAKKRKENRVEKKKMKMKPVRHLQVGYIHNPVTLFWVLRWRYNFTTSNASKILSVFHAPLQKLAMVLTWIKKAI